MNDRVNKDLLKNQVDAVNIVLERQGKQSRLSYESRNNRRYIDRYKGDTMIDTLCSGTLGQCSVFLGIYRKGLTEE